MYEYERAHSIHYLSILPYEFWLLRNWEQLTSIWTDRRLGIKTSGWMVTRQVVDLINRPAYQQNCSSTKNLTTRIFSGLFGPSLFWRCNQNSDLWVSSITKRKCIYFVSNKGKILIIFNICLFSGNNDAFENLLFRHVEKLEDLLVNLRPGEFMLRRAWSYSFDFRNCPYLISRLA